MKLYEKKIKRVLDLIIACIALLILCPLLIIVSVLVRIKLGRPILFKQERPGLNEKIFTLYKFRTMTDEKDENGILLSDSIRLTKFGKFLRSTSLDELPQLVNIIKGDISLIGPRPLLVNYLPLYNEEQRRRHNVRPGLVGLAGVKGRNNQNWDDKFRYDIEYVDKLSFRMDMRIFFSAIVIVFIRSGVNLEGEATTTPFLGNKDNNT